MPIVQPCSDPSCDVLTMGTFCLEHERATQAFRSGGGRSRSTRFLYSEEAGEPDQDRTGELLGALSVSLADPRSQSKSDLRDSERLNSNRDRSQPDGKANESDAKAHRKLIHADAELWRTIYDQSDRTPVHQKQSLKH